MASPSDQSPKDLPAACSRPDPRRAGWPGLPVALRKFPERGEVAPVHVPEPELSVGVVGTANCWYSSGAIRRDIYTAPGLIGLIESGFEADRMGWRGTPRERIVVAFPAETVNRLIPGNGRSFDPPTICGFTNDRVANLVHALWDDASSGSPYGALYGQGLALALVGLIAAEYPAMQPRAASCTTRFTSHQQSLLRDYVMAHIAENLCIERMASQVAMSPDHFARVFKATFKLSPHTYVIEKRLEVARNSLRQTPMKPIAEIASAVGFSSQSHFTAAFRQKTGTTPARWRRINSQD